MEQIKRTPMDLFIDHNEKIRTEDLSKSFSFPTNFLKRYKEIIIKKDPLRDEMEPIPFINPTDKMSPLVIVSIYEGSHSIDVAYGLILHENHLLTLDLRDSYSKMSNRLKLRHEKYDIDVDIEDYNLFIKDNDKNLCIVKIKSDYLEKLDSGIGLKDFSYINSSDLSLSSRDLNISFFRIELHQILNIKYYTSKVCKKTTIELELKEFLPHKILNLKDFFQELPADLDALILRFNFHFLLIDIETNPFDLFIQYLMSCFDVLIEKKNLEINLDELSSFIGTEEIYLLGRIGYNSRKKKKCNLQHYINLDMIRESLFGILENLKGRYQQSFDIWNKINNSPNLFLLKKCSVVCNMAEPKFTGRNVDQDLNSINEAIDIYKKLVDTRMEFNMISLFFRKKALLLIDIKKFNEAKKILEWIFGKKSEFPDDFNTVFNMIQIGDLFIELNDPKTALEYYLNSSLTFKRLGKKKEYNKFIYLRLYFTTKLLPPEFEIKKNQNKISIEQLSTQLYKDIKSVLNINDSYNDVQSTKVIFDACDIPKLYFGHSNYVENIINISVGILQIEYKEKNDLLALENMTHFLKVMREIEFKTARKKEKDMNDPLYKKIKDIEETIFYNYKLIFPKIESGYLDHGTKILELAKLYDGIQSFEKLLEIYFKALEIFKKVPTAGKERTDVYNLIGDTYIKAQEFKSAIEYKLLALSGFKSLPKLNNDKISDLNWQLAILHKKTSNPKIALEYIDEAINVEIISKKNPDVYTPKKYLERAKINSELTKYNDQLKDLLYSVRTSEVLEVKNKKLKVNFSYHELGQLASKFKNLNLGNHFWLKSNINKEFYTGEKADISRSSIINNEINIVKNEPLYNFGF